MARGAGGGIPGNNLGQCCTSSSTLNHLLGVSGAPTGTVGGAAVGRRSMRMTSFGTPVRVGHAVFCGGGTQQHPLSAATAKNRVCNANWGPKRRLGGKMIVSLRFCTRRRCGTSPSAGRHMQIAQWQSAPLAAPVWSARRGRTHLPLATGPTKNDFFCARWLLGWRPVSASQCTRPQRPIRSGWASI